MHFLKLQLFGEEAAAVTAPDTQTQAVNSVPEGQSAPQTAAVEETFASVTGKGGKYEAEYKAAVSEIVRNRLKGAKENEARVKQIQPIIDMLGQQYGEDPSNIDGIVKKLSEDNHWYEQEAMDRGLPVDVVRQMRMTERQNAAMQQRLNDFQAEEEQRQSFQRLAEGFQGVTARYPQANLSDEINNRMFMSLVTNGFSPLEAYESAHYKDLQQAAMQYGVNRTVAEVQANAQRPKENALGSPNGAVISNDPRKWTREQRAEIKQRVARGEKIQL